MRKDNPRYKYKACKHKWKIVGLNKICEKCGSTSKYLKKSIHEKGTTTTTLSADESRKAASRARYNRAMKRYKAKK